MAKTSSPLQKSLIAFGVVVVLAATIGCAVVLATHQTQNSTVTDKTCASHSQTTRKVVIQGGRAIPAHTNGSICDVLVITNRDKVQRLMAFGLHEKHEPYDGVSERLVGPGQSLTITLVQSGYFRFHDHIDDLAQGTFTVVDSTH